MSASLLAKGSIPNDESRVIVPPASVYICIASSLDAWYHSWVYWVDSTCTLCNHIWNSIIVSFLNEKREEYHLHLLTIVGEVLLNGFLYFFNEKSTQQKLFKLFVSFLLTHLVNKA